MSDYRYDGTVGVAATLTLQGDGWTLVVKNNTGRTLGKPGIYALRSVDGTRINATVIDAAPIREGLRADFRVEFKTSTKPEDVGLMILLFGGENFGPLAPVQ